MYDLSGIPDGVPLPDDLPEPDDDADDEVGAVGRAMARAEPLRPDGTREATHRHWFRLPRTLDDDPHLHTALLGYATDWTGIGGRPLHLEGDTTGMISLDHAAWFHRPARADEWLLQDVQSLVNAGGRGTLRGVIRNQHGRDRRVDGPGDAAASCDGLIGADAWRGVTRSMTERPGVRRRRARTTAPRGRSGSARRPARSRPARLVQSRVSLPNRSSSSWRAKLAPRQKWVP